jgi:hypothetical protein
MAFTGCGENNSPTNVTPTQASFNLSVAPSPVTAIRCNPQCAADSGSATFAFSAGMTVTMQETAGIGATISAITLTGTAGGTTFEPLVFSAAEIVQLIGSNRISGLGSLSVPLNIVYSTPSGTANLAVSINVQLTDERNNQVTAAGQVNII